MCSFFEREELASDWQTTEAIRRVLLDLVRLLVDDPEQVLVEANHNGKNLTLNLHVSPRDLGKVIGRSGRTARSFRTVLGAIGKTINVRISLSIEGDPTTCVFAENEH